MSKWKWTDARNLCVDGRGWTETDGFFSRLPARAKPIVREVIWDLSLDTAGISVEFSSDAVEIRARWSMGDAELSAIHTPIHAHSGLDLYARTTRGQWRWAGQSNEIAQVGESALNPLGLFDGRNHEFRLYLPLFNSVSSLQIGVPEEASIAATLPRSERPIAYYGTSIVHGAGASRPGMSQVAILGRRLDYPVLNLGFSGNAIMESEVGELLAELDPVIYLLDPLPNMDASLIEKNAVDFVRTLRRSRPDTPIVLIEDRTLAAAWITPTGRERNVSNRRAFKLAYAKLLSESGGPLHYIEGDSLFGSDGDGSNDGSHANDLGASRVADCLEPILRELLQPE